MQKPLLYFEKIKIWEIGIMIFYVILSIEFIYFLRLAKSETQNSYLSIYAVGGQFLMYSFLYKSLRNFKVYVFWLIVSLLHFCLYYLLKENPSLICFHNNKIIGLRNTVFLVILFQVLRFISLRTQNQELVGFGKSKTDIFDHREITKTDWILYMVYIAVIFILLTI
jgi:hypothetical protein